MTREFILATKLYRPPLPPTLISRRSLTEQLDRLLHPSQKIGAVIAPAGYGKTTSVCDWVEQHSILNAWVSLEPSENDLLLFMQYLVAAIQSIVPDACANSAALIQRATAPHFQQLFTTFVNDLTAIHELHIVVLDDYHVIHDTDIHKFITFLIDHHPPQSKLLLISRNEPDIPLIRWRARNQLTELRAVQLRFSQQETAQLFQRITTSTISEPFLQHLYSSIEGWPTGIQLAAASAHTQNLTTPDLLSESSNLAIEYFTEEIVRQQSLIVQKFMRTTSILQRFCAALCVELLRATLPSVPQAKNMHLAEEPRSHFQADGEIDVTFDQPVPTHTFSMVSSISNCQSIIAELVQKNLFVVALDNNQSWYRYHHQFRDMLEQQLCSIYSEKEIKSLHRRAGRWFAEEGLVDEALYHFGKADAQVAKATLIEQHRHYLLDQEDFHTLERWLDHLPFATVKKRPALLLTLGWLAQARFRVDEIHRLLQLVRQSFNKQEMATESEGSETCVQWPPTDSCSELHSEFMILQCVHDYWRGHFSALIDRPQQALPHLAANAYYVRGLAVTAVALGHHYRNETAKGIALFQSEAEKAQPQSRYRLLLESELGNLLLVAGELLKAKTVLTLNRQNAATKQLGIGDGWTLVRLGEIYYEHNQLDEAQQYFAECADYIHYIHTRAAFICLRNLTITYQALGQHAEASATAELLYQYLLEQGNYPALNEYPALLAWLALQARDVHVAHRHIAEVDMKKVEHATNVLGTPQVIQCRLLLAREVEGESMHVVQKIDELLTYANKNNNQWIRIQAYCLLAQYWANNKTHRPQDDGPDHNALHFLGEALILGHRGGFIRLFVDFGNPMATMLDQFLVAQKKSLLNRAYPSEIIEYIHEILVAFHPHKTPSAMAESSTPGHPPTGIMSGDRPLSKPLTETLTEREQEILLLLARRYSNKEIAQHLTISPLTVKRHASNIYQKLGVKTRKQAVRRAVQLNMVEHS